MARYCSSIQAIYLPKIPAYSYNTSPYWSPTQVICSECSYIHIYITFTLTEGPSLNGRVILPPYFTSSKKYPVLVYVYGGPNSQAVSKIGIKVRMSHE